MFLAFTTVLAIHWAYWCKAENCESYPQKLGILACHVGTRLAMWKGVAPLLAHHAATGPSCIYVVR